MTKLKLWGALVLILLAAGAGLYGWWALDLRWRPSTIDRNQAEIAKLLDQAGWVSAGLPGPKLYLVCFREDEDCVRAWHEQLPALQAAKVDVRVILIARRDQNGLSRSTPAERATVAELWANRSWGLLQAWEAAPSGAWTAPGIRPADGDAARSALVAQSQAFVDQLSSLLKASGLARKGLGYPTLIWWDKQGRMRGRAEVQPPSYPVIRRELAG